MFFREDIETLDGDDTNVTEHSIEIAERDQLGLSRMP